MPECGQHCPQRRRLYSPTQSEARTAGQDNLDLTATIGPPLDRAAMHDPDRSSPALSPLSAVLGALTAEPARSPVQQA
jgi:hypothetical protein